MESSSQNTKRRSTEWHCISYIHNGKPEEVAVELPADANSNHQKEAVQFVQTLEDNHQIEYKQGPLAAGKTHQIVIDDDGGKRLVRKRFSAI
jgi:hypothetical protein